MKLLYFIIVFSCFLLSGKAQQKIKVKKEDNRFLLFKLGEQNDHIVKNQSDLFYIILPDSLKKDLIILVDNGRFFKNTNDTIFQFIPIKGMRYSHAFRGTTFEVLLEGTCPASNTIMMEVKNIRTKKSLLQNKFLVK